jgi:hypothetical protein
MHGPFPEQLSLVRVDFVLFGYFTIQKRSVLFSHNLFWIRHQHPNSAYPKIKQTRQ